MSKRLKKVLLVFITFVSACFYLIGNSIGESIQIISGKKPSELKIKVNKRKSTLDRMYIDKDTKKIFYFFGDEGLINGDFVNITEKPSDPSFISKTTSKLSRNSNEIRVINRGESKNIKYSIKKGEVKNRAIIDYNQEPKSLYVEFYDSSKKLKKIIKNDYKEIKIGNLYGEFDNESQEIKIKFNENNSSKDEIKDLEKQDKIEIFSHTPGENSENLSYSIEKRDNNENFLKIKALKKSENIYLTVFDPAGNVKKIYNIKVRVTNVKNTTADQSYAVWNAPVIDITIWDRKNLPIKRWAINTDISYGEETLHGGVTLPYIDIKMGDITIPTDVTADKIMITPTNNDGTAGNVILKNIKGEKISGRVYLVTASTASKSPIKGLNFEDILNSTSEVTFTVDEEKKADVYMRVYDLEKNLESLFIAGKLKYMKGVNSTFTVDIIESGSVTKVEKLPEINVLDLRDKIKENFKIKKNLLNLSEDIGIDVGTDIIWTEDKEFVDIKLLDIKLDNFKDEGQKIKNPYVEIKASKTSQNITLVSGGTTVLPEKYYLRVKNGLTKEADSIEHLNRIVGYKKAGAKSLDGDVGGIDVDAVVRLTKDEFIKLKNTAVDTVEIKGKDSSTEEIDVIFNSDYSDRKLSIPYTAFKLLKNESDRQNNEVTVDGTLFFKEIPEKNLNLVFDNKKNSNGRVGIRGVSQPINQNLRELLGNSVFDMRGGVIPRKYKDSDILELSSTDSEGITEFKVTTANPTIEGYKSATFKARNIDFELRIWNNTDKIELVMNRVGEPIEGKIVGIFEHKDENGNIQNKIKLNLYSSTKKIGMDSDIMKVWRRYNNSSEWNTEVEIINTTTSTGADPNLADEGGFVSLSEPFVSFEGDTVTLEPIRGRGEQGIDGRAIKLSSFTSSDKNLGTVNNGILTFDSLGKGSAKLELTLTKGVVESFFPLNKPHLDHQDLQVAEIVFGKGKRRVPVTTKVQLAEPTTESNNALPVRVQSEYIGKKYYSTGFYDKTSTVTLKDITPGSTRDIYTISGITSTGIVDGVGGTKAFRNKNLKTDVYVEVGATGQEDNAGIYLTDVILSKKSELFGIFTLDGGSKDIKEQEIWISKYSPIKEIQSLQSDFQSEANGEVKHYNKSITFARYDENDSQTSLGIRKNLGKIVLLGSSPERATEIKRNSKTLNKAKLPSKIKLIPKSMVSGATVTGYLSFNEDEIITEVEQKLNENKEYNIYLLISPQETNKLVSEEEYEIKGEYEAKKVDSGITVTSNLLYYGLETNNTSDLGLGEQIYEAVFSMSARFKVVQKKLLRVDLADSAKKALVKANNLEKNMRFYKNDGKYSIDLIGPSNYANLNVSGSVEPYKPPKIDSRSKEQNLKVTDLSTGRVVEGSIGQSNGGVQVENDLVDLNIFYSDKSDIAIGMNTKEPLEILNMGITKYKFKKGEVKLLLEFVDKIDSTNVISSNEITMKIPEFSPKDWYLDKQSLGSKDSKVLAALKYFSENNLVFELGEIVLQDIDMELMKDVDDPEGLRVEYEKEIELEKKDDPTKKISAKIILIDSYGNKIPDKNIVNKGRLALVIDKTQANYDLTETFVYKTGDIGLSDSTVNKPIRIGRKGYWNGLVESIQIDPIKIDENYSFIWNSGIVDISEWQRKNNSRSFDLNKTFDFGEEVVNGGVKIPYVDIAIGNIFILNEDSADTVRIKGLSNAGKIGSVLLKNKSGDTLTGRLYLKATTTGGTLPVKGYDNTDIKGSYSKVVFATGENKSVQVHLRVYDTEEKNKSLFSSGMLEYIEDMYSTIGIEILSGSTLKKTDFSLPKVEFVDLKDILKEKIGFNKIPLNFSEESGKNIGDRVVWVLGSRFVDIKLGEFIAQNLLDKTGKLKNPSLEIETKDDIPDIKIMIGGQTIKPVRYFIKLKNGYADNNNVINFAGYPIGNGKIYAKSEGGDISEVSGDIFVRLSKEDFEAIKSDSEKALHLKNLDDTLIKFKVLFNEDKPLELLEIPYGEFKTIKTDEDKENNRVKLNTLIYPKEMKESKLNLIFDPKKDSTGNISVRGTEAKINDIHSEIQGYSVFDMSKGILQNQYKDSDILEVEGDSITNARDIEISPAKFSAEGYKSVKFTGNNGIRYEVKIWNNTDKIEIELDKTSINRATIKHKGIIKLKTQDGKVLNEIDLNMCIYMDNIESAIGRTLVDNVHNGNLGVKKSYAFSPIWNTEVEVAEYGVGTTNRQVGIKNEYKIESYDEDKIYVEPTKSVGKEGIDGRWIEIVPFTSNTTQVGVVNDNRLELTADGTGTARLRLTLPKSWIENRWPDRLAKSFDILEGLDLVYGNGKRRVPQRAVALQYGYSGMDGKLETEIDLVEDNQRLSLAIFFNSNVGIKAMVKEPQETNFTELGRITQIQDVGEKELAVSDLSFKGKQLKRKLVVDVGGHRYGTLGVRFKDVPLVKDRAEIGDYTGERIHGAAEGLSYYKVSFPKYSPIKEAYSLSSSLRPEFGGKASHIEQKLELIRDDLSDSSTTQKIIKEIGNIGILGGDLNRENFIKRSSKTLNKVKLPKKVYMVFESAKDLSNAIPVQLSFNSSSLELEATQVQGLDIEKKIFLSIEKGDAEKIVPNTRYKLIGAYEQGEISEKDIIGDELLYIGLRTNNIDDLGLDEYIYDPIFKLTLVSEIEQDRRVRLNLFQKGEELPIPKSLTGQDKLVRVYLNDAKYSIDLVGHGNYGKLNMTGLLNPFEYDRKEFEVPHKMRVTDKITGRSVEGNIDVNGGYLTLDSTLARLSVGYSNRLSIREDLSAKDSREILTLGLLDYKFKGGNMTLLVEHFDGENPTPIISEEIVLRFPEFLPRRWYYNEKNKIEKNIVSELKYFNEEELIFPIGKFGLNPYRDRDVTIGKDDKKGVRIEFDKNIVLEDKNNSSNKVQARIVVLDKNGNINKSQEDIQEESVELAVVIDNNSPDYDETKTYIYRDGKMDIIDGKTDGKIVRIGRNNYWEGLIETIEIQPIKTKGLYLFDWKSGIVDLTKWNRGVTPRSFDLVEDVQFGTETSNGKLIPYIDIKMGNIRIFRGEKANVIALEQTSNVDRRGTVLLESPKGDKIVSKLYLKPGEENTSTRIPVKGYDNNNIPNSTLKVKFIDTEFKGVDVRLRVYDAELGEKTLFTNGIQKYLEGIYSNDRLFNIILEENGTENILKSDLSMPSLELINLKEKLDNKIRIDKKILNFSLNDGQNIDEDINWVLGDKFVDVRLAKIYLEEYFDKTLTIKNPYIEIDDSVSFIDGTDKESVYRYYLKERIGSIEESGKVTDGETGSTLGYKKVSATSKNGNVSSIEADLMIRLTNEQYKKIKDNPNKEFLLKKIDDTSAELKLVFNEDIPNKAVEVPFGEFKTIKTDGDKENNRVKLNTLIYPREMKESKLNLIFDPKKNNTGNISVRGTGAKINDIHSEIQGYSVFDMSKGILQNQYKDSDILEVEGDSITNARDIEISPAKFSAEGYKSVKFTGNNGIRYEVKIWNNTDKIEIELDKTSINRATIKHKGIIKLKTQDGKVLNEIDLNMCIYMDNIESAIGRTLVDNVHNGNLGVKKSYAFSPIWNTEVEVAEYGVGTTNRQVGIKNEYKIESYDEDKIYVEPTKSVGKEGIDGRWIEIVPFTSNTTQVGVVNDNRLELTADGTGTARLRLTLPKSWIENRWPDRLAKSFDILEGLDLVYGNGKRRVPQRAVALQYGYSGMDGKLETEIDLVEDNQRLSLAIFFNSNVGIKAMVKEPQETNFTELGRITQIQDVGEKELAVSDLSFKGKQLKRKLVVDVGGHRYGTLGVRFKDVPLVKDRAEIGDYTGERIRGAAEGLNYYKVSFPKYSPIKEAYSLSSSLKVNYDGIVNTNQKPIEFYREDVEDRETTFDVNKELGSIILIGADEKKSKSLLRSSKTLNMAKLPNSIKLKRIENGIMTKEILGKLSFSIDEDIIEFSQKKLKEDEIKVYLKISKEEAEKLDDKGIYIIECEYDAGRVSDEKIVTDNAMYLGIKTDNTADLGFDEYIYEPTFKVVVTASLIKDNSVKISLVGSGDQKPIPKVVGVQGLIRAYKNNIQYSSEINPDNYAIVQSRGYMNPYNHSRDDLNQNHIFKITDETTGMTGHGMVNSIGGYAHITTPLGIFRVGYGQAKGIANGMGTTDPLEITTIGIKKYNFKRGDLRLILEHLDPSNNTTPIYTETIVVGIPKFEPKGWYYNEANQNKLMNYGTKYMKYFTNDKITYILGTVGLNQDRDRSITIGDDDSVGARIEYDKDIELEDKASPSKKINAKIVKLDSDGNKLADGDIIESEAILGIEIDITQSGYDSTKTYVLKGMTPNVVDSDNTNKPVRIGRTGHWEALTTNIELRPVIQGDLTLNVMKNYFRNALLSFDSNGGLTSGTGAGLTLQREFFKNIPNEGVIKVYKWKSDADPYGEKLAESQISGGALIGDIDVDNRTTNKTNYKMKISKMSSNGVDLSLSYWGEDISREKLFIEISDSNGITSLHKLGLNIVGHRSMIYIDYVNSFAPGYEFAPGEQITQAVGNSLYMGTILNPKSFMHQNQRPQLESVNSLKISYVGEDMGLVNAIDRIRIADRNVELTNIATGKKINIEDITFHKTSKRYNANDGSSAFFEETYKMKGYVDLKRFLDLSDGEYRGTVRLEIEIN